MGVVARARSLPPKIVASKVETAIEEKDVTDIKRLIAAVQSRTTNALPPTTTRAPVAVADTNADKVQKGQGNRSRQSSVSRTFFL